MNERDSTAAGAVVRTWRIARAVVAVAAVAALAGCGGGGGPSDVGFDVGVIVQRQPQAPVFAGQPANVVMLAGQSIELDASEPADWFFTVNGSPLFGSGTTVIVQGLAITQSAISPSRVVIDTSLNGPTALPIFVDLSAASTFESALVPTVTLEIR